MYTRRMAETRAGKPKDHRWNLRVEESEDELVRAASRVAETKVSSFVREAAVGEARRVLADRTRFTLDEGRWEQFCEMLDRPARVPPGLRRLFSRPSVFD